MGSRHSPEREIAFAMTRRIMGPEDAKTEQMQNNCRIDRGKPIQDWVPVQINDLDTAEYTSAPPPPAATPGTDSPVRSGGRQSWAEQELLRLNRALRVLSACNRAVSTSRDEGELLQNLCRIVVEVGGYRTVWVSYAEHDEARTVRPVAHAGGIGDYIDQLQLTWAETERGMGPTADESHLRHAALEFRYAVGRRYPGRLRQLADTGESGRIETAGAPDEVVADPRPGHAGGGIADVMRHSRRPRREDREVDATAVLHPQLALLEAVA